MTTSWTAAEWSAVVSAAAAVINIALVGVLVAATIYYAKQTKATVDELREARVADSLPAIHWQLHPQSAGVGYRAGSDYLDLTLVLLATNVGPGPARLLDFEAATDQGEAFAAPEVGIPSTLPQRERIELRLTQRRKARDYPGTRTVRIRVRYADLHGLRLYETRPVVVGHWTHEDAHLVSFDADERSPQERQVVR